MELQLPFVEHDPLQGSEGMVIARVVILICWLSHRNDVSTW